jgi:hypothetical protein
MVVELRSHFGAVRPSIKYRTMSYTVTAAIASAAMVTTGACQDFCVRAAVN